MSNENNQVEWRLQTWFPDLDPGIISQLKSYSDELHKFSRTINLVSSKTLLVADQVHFADSILAHSIISSKFPSLGRLHDFGSGNGFPGLVFAILDPRLEMILVDTDERKCQFLKFVISKLGLKNASVLNVPVESLKDVNYVVSRGFASIARLSLLMKDRLSSGGTLFHLKGDEWANEIGEMPTQLCSYWQSSLLGEYRVPVSGVKLAIVTSLRV